MFREREEKKDEIRVSFGSTVTVALPRKTKRTPQQIERMMLENGMAWVHAARSRANEVKFRSALKALVVFLMGIKAVLEHSLKRVKRFCCACYLASLKF